MANFFIESGPVEKVEAGANYNRFWGHDGTLRAWELDAEIETHLPAEHEYIRTFLEYQEYLGTGRVLAVLRVKQGDIWNVASIRKLKQVTDTLAALPGIDRRTVTSLWTPNIKYLELTEEGLHTEDVIGAGFTAETLTQEEVERVRNRVRRGGLDGRVVGGGRRREDLLLQPCVEQAGREPALLATGGHRIAALEADAKNRTGPDFDARADRVVADRTHFDERHVTPSNERAVNDSHR